MSLYHNNNVVPKERANKVPSRICLGAILLIPLFLLEQTFNQLKTFECQQNTFRLPNSLLFHLISLFQIVLNHFQGKKRKELPESIKTSIQSIPLNSGSNVKDIVIQFQEALQLKPASLAIPEPETKSMIRDLALRAKSEKRDDLVRHLRDITPAGTTGEFEKMKFFFALGRGDRFLRYKEVLTQTSSQCTIKLMST